jgi:hypothetical protein
VWAVTALCWEVVAIDERGHGHGTCGHEHDSDEGAYACPWWPEPAPSVDVAGFVRQVRRRGAVALSRGRLLRRSRARQFGLPGVGS